MASRSRPEVSIPQTGKQPGTPEPAKPIDYYPPGPVARNYLRDDSFIVGIRGPFGSGKSAASVMKIIKNAQTQRVGNDGWKRRRTAIIRNTYPELRTTTMNTWHQWVPQHIGKWRESGPPMQHIKLEQEKIDWEIVFVALDRPDDLNKLLGMELSDAWINEAREIPKAVLDGLAGRVGRYPPVWQGGCDNVQIIMDTNSPDTDHWWYTLAEEDTSDEDKRQMIESTREAEEILRTGGILRPTQKLMSFHTQPSGRSPEAENVKNLRPGYYTFLQAGKDQDWIKVYIDNEYGFVMEGRPVYPEYRESIHKRDHNVIPALGISIGMDFGLTPAATIEQRLANGRWLVHDELVSKRLGITTFAQELARMLTAKYPGIPVVSARGDPAGDAMTPEESTCFKILQAAGIDAKPAPTNDPTRRREAMRYLLRTHIDGEPGIVINGRCLTLRKGLAGGFHYKRVQVSGDARYKDQPDKNQFSHVCEALEYDLVSAGEDRNVTTSAQQRTLMNSGKLQRYAESEYDIFSS